MKGQEVGSEFFHLDWSWQRQTKQQQKQKAGGTTLDKELTCSASHFF